MSGAIRLQLDEERYVHQTVDGEVLIIDVQGGAYYCLRGSAAAIWPMVVAGAAQTEILAVAQTAFAGPAAEIAASVTAFLDRLAAEGIVRSAAGSATAPDERPIMAAPAGRTPFVPLTIERYDDMRDLLTLDPVHDVAEAGWPNLPR